MAILWFNRWWTIYGSAVSKVHITPFLTKRCPWRNLPLPGTYVQGYYSWPSLPATNQTYWAYL